MTYEAEMRIRLHRGAISFFIVGRFSPGRVRVERGASLTATHRLCWGVSHRLESSPLRFADNHNGDDGDDVATVHLLPSGSRVTLSALCPSASPS